MSKLLKKVARDIIEIVFPMSKAIAVSLSFLYIMFTNKYYIFLLIFCFQIPPSVAMHHLYKVCLNCVRTLYMLDLREEFCPVGFWTSEKIFIPPELSRNNYLSESLLSTHMLGHQRSNGKCMWWQHNEICVLCLLLFCFFIVLCFLLFCVFYCYNVFFHRRWTAASSVHHRTAFSSCSCRTTVSNTVQY